jgi:hypothetical protein
MSNIQQNAEHRNIAVNPFVRYKESTIQGLLNQAIIVVQTPGTEVQLIADTAVQITLLNDGLGVFNAGREAELEMTENTTGIWVIERLTGKTWKELNAPTLADKAAQVTGSVFNKFLNAVSKGASSLADKTKR